MLCHDENTNYLIMQKVNIDVVLEFLKNSAKLVLVAHKAVSYTKPVFATILSI